MKIMGLDVGDRRIGIALSDDEGVIALPRETLKRESTSKDVDRLAALALKEAVGRIVVGLPISLDGTEGPQAKKTRGFIASLSGRTAVPVDTWDERLTTVAAERSLLESDVSRARRRDVVDQVAATLMLQSYLDCRRARENQESATTERT